jgi:ribosome-binding ATPase YchF (GTP1/OBG family)
MSLAIGIAGLPNVGKSTLFNALTKQQVNVANYPFTTIDANLGKVIVSDKRLEQLFKISKTEKIVPLTVEFVDLAGLVKNAHQGQGLGNQFLARIREVSAILHLIRCFRDGEVVHIEASINPLRDLETVNLELIFKDLEILERVLVKLDRDIKSGDRQKIREKEILEQAKKILEQGKLLNTYSELINEPAVKNLYLLTAKPQLYVLNGKAEEVSEELLARIKQLSSSYLIIDLSQPVGLEELVKECFQLLDLISFFTITGRSETRSWAVKRGTKAQQAAGVVHTDFEKNFIRMEVINWEKLLEAGLWQNAKQKGWIRSEGKEYLVQDGDVVEIKHNA